MALRPQRRSARQGSTSSRWPTPSSTFLEALASQLEMVREFIEAVIPNQLVAPPRKLAGTRAPETVLSCPYTLLDEEWVHHWFAVRDLDAISSPTAC